MDGLFQHFGIKRSDNELRSLMALCILYDARRLGKRARDDILQGRSEFTDHCIEVATGTR